MRVYSPISKESQISGDCHMDIGIIYLIYKNVIASSQRLGQKGNKENSISGKNDKQWIMSLEQIHALIDTVRTNYELLLSFHRQRDE